MKKLPLPKSVTSNGTVTTTFPSTPVSAVEGVSVAPKPDRVPEITPVVGTPLIKHLDSDEYSLIFQTTLRKQHKDNHTVLAFIREYVQCRDVSQASKAVGISKRDGNMLRNRKDIFDCISKITENQVMKYGIDAEEIVKKVWDIADFDPADVIDKATGGAITNVHDIPYEARRAIKKMKVKNLWEEDENGIKVVVGEMVEFEFWDKLKASEMVGREFGKFKESMVVEHGPTKDMKEILLESMKRAERDVVEIGHSEDSSGVVEMDHSEGGADEE